EENAGEQAELLRIDAEVAIHGQSREADVNAVEKGDNVKDENEGKDAALNFADGGSFDGGGNVLWLWCCHGTRSGTTGSEVLGGADGVVRDAHQTVGEDGGGVKEQTTGHQHQQILCDCALSHGARHLTEKCGGRENANGGEILLRRSVDFSS